MFIPCLGVDIEPATIHDPLHTIQMPAGVNEQFLLDEIWFYVVLTDGVGSFRLSVELHAEEDIILKTSKPQTYIFKGGAQLNVLELPLRMTLVPFPRPGVYEFRLVANHVHLQEGGTALLRVLPG
jgi:hypothetical protein